MGRLSASLLALSLGAVAALGLVACGSSGKADLLPGNTANEITANLDQVKSLATEGDCVGAEDAAQAVSAQIEALGGVDKRLKLALQEGASRLNEVVASCEEAPEEEETSPAVDEAEESPEVVEKKQKPEKPKKEAEAAPEETTPAPPTQAEGEAKGHEEGEVEAPPAETGGTPSGGVGPGEPAGSG
ncbi:MAG TPA: hypothetical protein VIH47_07240 [Solirubrobacterales bacterium]